MTRKLLTASIAALCTFIATYAHADTRVTVHDFYGPNAEQVRDDVVNLLERQSGVTIISKGQIENAAEKLGVDPYSPEGRIAVGRDLQLSAWMTGVVRKRSGKLKLTVVVFDGAQHTPIGITRLSGTTATKLSAEIKERLWRKSRYAIMRASAPNPSGDPVAVAEAAPPEAPAPEAPAGEVQQASDSESPFEVARANAAAAAGRDEAEDEVDSPAEPTSKPRAGEMLRAFLGFGSPYRNLAYSNPITPSLGDYQLGGAPMFDLNLAFHPAKTFTDGWASWIGIEFKGQLALATPTIDRDGNEFKSTYNSYHFGLRARLPVGQHYIAAFSGYGMNRFEVTSEERGVRVPTPSVDYRMIRSGAGAEFELSDTFMLGADAAWLHILSVGDIGTWFPRSTAGGIEATLFATYALIPGVYARASASYQRTFFDFNPRPSDKYAAGGATDQYLAMSVGAGIEL